MTIGDLLWWYEGICRVLKIQNEAIRGRKR